jgi:hypothetical protein
MRCSDIALTAFSNGPWRSHANHNQTSRFRSASYETIAGMISASCVIEDSRADSESFHRRRMVCILIGSARARCLLHQCSNFSNPFVTRHTSLYLTDDMRRTGTTNCSAISSGYASFLHAMNCMVDIFALLALHLPFHASE